MLKGVSSPQEPTAFIRPSPICRNNVKVPVVLVLTETWRGIMSLPSGRQCNRLPKHFPAGTVYVVEGCGGQYGRLRISSRYIVMPSGRKLEIPADFDRVSPARLGQRRRIRRSGKARAAAATQVPAAKKFAVVAGTAHQERR
jgi:hypothetical protein